MSFPVGIVGGADAFVLVEDRLSAEPSARLYRAPQQILCARTPDEADGVLCALDEALCNGAHAAGLFGYELGFALEARLAPGFRAAATPLVWLGLFDTVQRLDPAALDETFARLAPPPPLQQLAPALDAAAYAKRMARTKDLIAAGDIYQANLTFPADFSYDGDPFALYAAMRASQPVAHGALLRFEGTCVLSVSPELFVARDRDRLIVRPMKGTTPRGQDAKSDLAAAKTLTLDPKQRAENLMILDLMRNDLSRLAAPGGVRVKRAFEAETYPTFHAMTSTVEALAADGVTASAAIRALFPCGSVTGAPKIRAMEILRDLEDRPRGVYTGSIGAFSPHGDFSLNVAIRTAVIDADGRGVYGVGGGITAGSKAEEEYAECLLKLKVLSDLAAPFGLIETLRWSGFEGYVRLPAHLDRMQEASAELGFAFDRDRLISDLDALATGFGAGAPDQRVRIELARDGEAAITHAPLDPQGPAPLRLAIARRRVDHADPFLRRKTTRRAVWDEGFAEARALGCDEALFLNRREEVTEASRFSVFVEMEDGAPMLTPTLACGLLPGILRAELIAQGKAVEAVMTLTDLHAARRIFLGNSLRGLVPAMLA